MILNLEIEENVEDIGYLKKGDGEGDTYGAMMDKSSSIGTLTVMKRFMNNNIHGDGAKRSWLDNSSFEKKLANIRFLHAVSSLNSGFVFVFASHYESFSERDDVIVE